MIGLDAADPILVERWTADGTLPNLRALMAAGASGRLASSALHLAGSPWPTFYTGQPPSVHGIYHDAQWRHERMELASPAAGWLPVQPFWRALEGGLDVIAYDVPFTASLEPFPGTEIANWAVHDKLVPPASHPAELLAEVRRRFGEWPMSQETFGRSRLEELLGLREHLLENTRRSTELALWLLQRPWKLAIIALSAIHRGGHRLWDRSSVEGEIPPGPGEVFDGALRDLYVACDRAVGELVAAAPDAAVVTFSVHGMGINSARHDLLDGMLSRILANGEGSPPSRGLLRRAGEALPLGWRRALTTRIPSRLRDRIMTRWQTGGLDWARTPAFSLRADLQGYVRLNLVERELRGIVPPGEYSSLCDRIAEGLAGFRDADTGEPFIEEIHRVDRLFTHGARRDRLPDLIVRWKYTLAAPHRKVAAPGLGVVERSTPGRIPGGRSGNHRGEGFLAVRGPGVPAGVRLREGSRLEDLAPTVLALLGARARVPLAGRPIAEVVSGGGGAGD
ncbi:MAG TPA: alkaline phosphatase family protein [Gemmatimonadota bacterium]